MKILKDLDAILITNPTNIRYLTGFVGVAPEEREAYCLLAQESVYLFTSALYLEQSKNLESSCEAGSRSARQIPMTKQRTVTAVEISREEPFSKKLAEILTGRGPVKRLGFEENNVTVAEYKNLEKELKGITLVSTQGHVEELRMIKRSDEIKNIRTAARLTDECFDFILDKLKAVLSAGTPTAEVTEAEIAWEIETFVRSRGAELAFSPIVAFNSNTSQPHYIPQPQGPALSVDTPNIVLLDFGAKVNGYCSDMTRMVFVGKPKDDWKRAYETVLDAQQSALNYLQAQGRALSSQLSGSQTDRIAREVIKKAGFPVYPHSLGHGVGLDIHEAPRLSIKKDQSLKPGMVVTVEPAIYSEANYGIRIEDLVVLKKEGIEILSKSSKVLTIL